MNRLALLFLTSVVIVACSSVGTGSDNSDGQAPTERRYAVLDCGGDCEGLTKINIWETPDRAGLATTGQLPINSRVEVLDSRTVDGVLHYQITASGITGWVSHLFLTLE